MDPIIVKNEGEGVASVILNRPEKLNAIDLPMLDGLQKALADIESNDAVRTIVFRAAGRAFCVGDDVEAQAEICNGGAEPLRAQLSILQNITEMLMLGDKLVVGAIRGWAIGAGFSWALNCDVTVWGASARASLPELKYGTAPTGGVTYLLPLLAGRQRARVILLGGEPIDAEALLAAGLAHRVVDDAQVDDDALDLARALASRPRQSAQVVRRILQDAERSALQAALAAETEACMATTLAPDTIARMRAAILREG